MENEQIVLLLGELNNFALNVDLEYYGLPLFNEDNKKQMMDIVKRHLNVQTESKNKYRVDGIIYQGHQTIDEVMASLSGSFNKVISCILEKDLADFEKDFIEAGVLNANETLIAVKALLATRKISAIKLVRAHTNWGLKEAKEFVENNF